MQHSPIQPDNVVPIWRAHPGFALARKTLREQDASEEAMRAACDVLEASHDWDDVWLVDHMRRELVRREQSRRYMDDLRASMEAMPNLVTHRDKPEPIDIEPILLFLRWTAAAFALYFGWAMWSLARVKGWL